MLYHIMVGQKSEKDLKKYNYFYVIHDSDSCSESNDTYVYMRVCVFVCFVCLCLFGELVSEREIRYAS